MAAPFFGSVISVRPDRGCEKVPVREATYALYPEGHTGWIKIHTKECDATWKAAEARAEQQRREAEERAWLELWRELTREGAAKTQGSLEKPD